VRFAHLALGLDQPPILRALCPRPVDPQPAVTPSPLPKGQATGRGAELADKVRRPSPAAPVVSSITRDFCSGRSYTVPGADRVRTSDGDRTLEAVIRRPACIQCAQMILRLFEERDDATADDEPCDADGGKLAADDPTREAWQVGAWSSVSRSSSGLGFVIIESITVTKISKMACRVPHNRGGKGALPPAGQDQS
jgi:hypothetical protein